MYGYSIYRIFLVFWVLSLFNAGCSITKPFKQSPLNSSSQSNSRPNFTSSQKGKPEQAAVRKALTPVPLSNIPLPQSIPNTKIIISKTNRKLFLFSGKKLLREYQIKIGQNPVDDKIKAGDNCTPEGKYYVCVKNPKSKYHLSLGLSYPNINDAARGLRKKLISKKQYKRIAQRIKKRRIPLWDTPLGGEIFVHGKGELYDWTHGCIAMKSDDIEELYRLVKIGDSVEILK